MTRGAARARGGAGCARRGARRGGARRGPRRLRHRRAGDRQDLARHPVPARPRRRTRGCSSAPATTSRSRGRSGPIRDLVGSVSAPLEEALSAGAAPHEIQTLLIAELELPPRPTVLVLEDVHWADDATLRLDHRARAADRLAAGAARPDVPRAARRRRAIRCTRRRRDPRRRLGRSSSSRRCRRAPSPRSPATARTRSTPRPGATRSTSPSCSPRGPPAELPPSVANAVLGRASRLDDAGAAPRGAGLGRAEPRRARPLLDAVMPDWAAAAEEPERRQLLEVDATLRPLPPRAGAERDQVEPPDRRAAAAARRDPRRRCWPRTPIRPTSSTTPRPRAPRTSSPTTRSSPRGGRRRSSRTARRTPTTAAPRTSSTGCRCAEQAAVLEELATPPTPSAGSTTRSPRSSARSRSTGSSATRRRVGRCTRSCRGSTGSPATATPRARRRSRRSRSSSRSATSVELARAYSGVSQLAMLAEDARAGARLGRAGARARDPARRRAHPRARARQHRQRAGSSSIAARSATLLEAHAVADAAGDRHEATRALDNLGYQPAVLGAARTTRCAYAQQARRLRARSTRCTSSRPTRPP